MKPTFSMFLVWLLKQKDSSYDFISPTDCVVARFVAERFKTTDGNDPYVFEGGNWSSMFPGETYEDRLQNYHWLCSSKPMNYKCVLLRASYFI